MQFARQVKLGCADLFTEKAGNILQFKYFRWLLRAIPKQLFKVCSPTIGQSDVNIFENRSSTCHMALKEFQIIEGFRGNEHLVSFTIK